MLRVGKVHLRMPKSEDDSSEGSPSMPDELEAVSAGMVARSNAASAFFVVATVKQEQEHKLRVSTSDATRASKSKNSPGSTALLCATTLTLLKSAVRGFSLLGAVLSSCLSTDMGKVHRQS